MNMPSSCYEEPVVHGPAFGPSTASSGIALAVGVRAHFSHWIELHSFSVAIAYIYMLRNQILTHVSSK